MANLTYRQAIQQAPAGTTTKNATLTSQEIDGNFKSLNDELITKAPLVSPGFSGVPTAPTATAGTNTTQLATTAFVQTGLSGRQPLDAELTAISGLSANGLITRTGASTAASRSIAVSGTGLSVTNADGVAGNPTVTSNATAANTVSTIVARDASGNFSAGTITAALAGNAATATKLVTARTISLTGDVTGSVSFDGSANASITATVVDDSHNHIIANVDGLQTALDGKVAKDSNTGSATLPAGTTAQRSAVPVAGALRFNSTLMQFEGYDGTAWGTVGAVIERGSNANGEYVRFTDGTQICSCFTEGVVSDPGGQVIWFPASFATSPFPISMLQHRDSFSSASLLSSGVSTTSCTIYKYSDTSTNPEATDFSRYYIRTIVVGRWF